MKNTLLALLAFFLVSSATAQSYYPPLFGNVWDTLSPTTLGWCPDQIDSLNQFLEDKNSKSFMVLKGGKIVLEEYYGTFERDSFWYWASAGKSVVGFLVGMAQEEGHLDINDPTSLYLGQGWTNATSVQEAQITIRHQISMTTGLDDNTPDLNCVDDSCLNYLTAPDTRWAYYNAPYRLVQNVVASATGMTFSQYTNTTLGARIGMGGFWYNFVRWGKTRDLARFGLLSLNKGIWNGDTLLADTSYFNAMVNTANNYNPAYGYLWWLNGKTSYQIPQVQFNFPGSLIPPAPADMYCALGKNDQKIYVIPSEDMVVVRMGNAADNSVFALSEFDDSLFTLINKLNCATSLPEPEPISFSFFPNPASESLQLTWDLSLGQKGNAEIRDLQGRILTQQLIGQGNSSRMDLTGLKPGFYLLRIQLNGKEATRRLVLR